MWRSRPSGRATRRWRPAGSGVRSPSRYGSIVSPPAPGGAAQRELGELAEVRRRAAPRPRPARRAALRVQTSGRNRPVASANPATAPVGSAAGRRADREDGARRSDRDDHVAGASAEAERRRGVVAGAGPEHRPPAPSRRRGESPPSRSAAEFGVGQQADRVRRAEHQRDGELAAGREPQQVGPVGTGRGRPVPGAAGVAAIGAQRAPGPQPPASCQVSQSCGRQTAAARAIESGSCSASQRSLVTVKDATGTLPAASAQAIRPRSGSPSPSSAIRSSAAAAERVSFHSSAGRTTLAVGVQAHHAVLLPGHRHRGDVAQPAGLRRARPPARAATRPESPRCRRGCGAWPERTSAPVSASRITTLHDWVEESTPATSARTWHLRALRLRDPSVPNGARAGSGGGATATPAS